MSRLNRMLIGTVALALGLSLIGSPPAVLAEGGESPVGLLDETEAVALALATGEPVVASALTDEHTLVTADPDTGELRAELSAGVARVPDGAGGWREPSARLVAGPDGTWRTEATAVPVTVSGDGGVFLTLGDGDDSVAFGWPEALPDPVVAGDLATFAEVAPGVDLVVRAAVDGAESYLVVKNAEAARNPLVRQVPITLAADGLDAVVSESGTVTYVDDDGQERFWIPPAYLWDSAGQPTDASLAELLEPAEGSRVEELPADAEVPASAGRVAFDAGTSVWDILDDLATVFPVVIDPSATASQSYAVRVTEDFTKFNSDIGSRGKLGYNGWTSPYYKSRMYYQFKWPTISGAPVVASRINSAEFSYVQTHSPQHSCTDTDYGPAVKVQFHYVVDSGTKWSNQPDVHPDIGSVSNDYAVGHQDVCGNTYRQRWNVSTMVRNERTKYDTRTTVTVGIRSADESDKNGWREYQNSTDSSPKLTLVIQAAPVAPAAPSFSDMVATGMTSSLTPTLSVKVSLQSGDSCVTINCMHADFEVTKPGGAIVTLSGGRVANGGTSSVTVPTGTMTEFSRYSVRARARSVDGTGSAWGPSTTIDVRTNAAPAAPTALQVLTDSGTVITASPALVTAAALRLRATAPAGTWCPPETPNCLGVEFTIDRGTTPVKTATVTGLRAGDQASTPVINIAGLDGDYKVHAKAFRSWSLARSAAPERDLKVLVPPAKPDVTNLASDHATLTFRVQVTPALFTSYTYAWKVDFTDPAHGGVVDVYEGTVTATGDANIAVSLPLEAGQTGEASLTVTAATPAKATSVRSDPDTVTVFA